MKTFMGRHRRSLQTSPQRTRKDAALAFAELLVQ